MKFRYINYADQRFSQPEGWLNYPVIESSQIYNEDVVIDFFDRFARTFEGVRAGGRWTDFHEVGVIEGVSRVRYFDAKTGRQYSAMWQEGGASLDAYSIVKNAFFMPSILFRNKRSIRPIRVQEGDVIHLAVDADFQYDPDDHPSYYDPISLTYRGEIA